MVRTAIGGLVGGLVLFVMGFVFWATPLSDLAFSKAGDVQSAAVQQAMAANLTESGTGAYIVPGMRSAQSAVLYAKGPIATVFYNTRGYSPEDYSMILPGFIVALIAGLFLSFGLSAVAGQRSFAERARLVVLIALAFTTWEFLGSPIFNHFGWGYWIYTFIAESVVWIAAGLVVARWFLPGAVAVTQAPETAAMAAAAE